VTHEPIGRALVYSAGQRFAAFTDDHGHFERTLQAVENSNVRTQTNSRVFLQAKKPGFLGDPTQQRSTVVVPGQKDVTLSLVPEALIVGHVKFPSAEAADHVQVQLCRREVRDGFAQWTPLTNVTTRSDGEFRFADLPAGEYKLFTLETTEQDPLASIPNGPVFGFPPRFFAAARDFATADTIRVRAGETFIANIAPERQRYYDVRVPVMVPEPADVGLGVSVYAQGHRGPGFAKRGGKGVPGAMIVMVPKDPEAHGELFRRDQSDLDGTFSLGTVIPGEYTIVAIENGWDLNWSQPGVIAHYLPKGRQVVVAPTAQEPVRVSEPLEVQPR
jgi:hypothetical protein